MKLNYLLIALLSSAIFIGCGKKPADVAPQKYYADSQAANETLLQSTSTNNITNPNGLNFSRPDIAGGAEIIIGTDTFAVVNYGSAGYGYTYTPTEAGRFISNIYLNSSKIPGTTKSVDLQVNLSTLLSPMVGIHALGWYYDVPWTHSTYVNDMALTYYSASTVSVYSLCTETNLPSAPTSYTFTIISSQVVNGITVVSGSFIADVCLNSRNHSSGYLSIKGTFTNIPLYPH
jgi:hypothetical protein